MGRNFLLFLNCFCFEQVALVEEILLSRIYVNLNTTVHTFKLR